MNIQPTQLNVSQKNPDLQVQDVCAGTVFQLKQYGNNAVYMKVTNGYDVDGYGNFCHAINLTSWTVARLGTTSLVQIAKLAEINVKF